MTDLWYYAEGGEPRGPLSLNELVPLLARVADPRRVMIWHHGFDDWKAVEDVREVALQLVRPPPPLRPTPPPVPPIVRKPAVDAADAAAFRNVKPELTGINGWLGLLAFGQVVEFCDCWRRSGSITPRSTTSSGSDSPLHSGARLR
jgi:hypothetical protein